MIRRWSQYILLTLAIIAVGAVSRSVEAAPGVGGSSCVNNVDCTPPGSLICSYEAGADYRTCQSLNITVTAPTVTATSISTTVKQNGNFTMQVYGCLGSSGVCQAQPLSNTDVWKLLGTTTGVNANFVATYSGLRPGRTYTLTIAGSEANSIAYAQVAAATTWPGTPPTPTDAHVACNGATGLCSRQISWTTNFSSDSRVIYGQNPQGWALASNPRDTGSNLASLTSTPSGKIWGVGFGGRIISRDPAGNWAAQTSPLTSMLYSVSAADDTHAWAVGQNGYVISTQDGVNWAGPTVIAAGNSFLSVYASSPQTAWAAGGALIYAFNGTSWVQKYSDASTNFNDVVTIDNKEVWAVGSNGAIRHTQNGYQTWGSATPPNWTSYTTNASDSLSSIATFNGKVIWAGGNNLTTGNARLYRSTDSGNSWTEVTQVRTLGLTVDNIVVVDDNTIWFSGGYSVVRLLYNAGVPQITVYGDPGALIGSPVYSLTATRLNELVAGGEQQNMAVFSMPPSSSTQTSLTSTTNHSVTLTDLAPDTTYYYAVESSGSGVMTGNFGSSFRTPTIDLTPPSVSINPIPSPTRSCPLTVSGTASDNITVTSVAVQLDGTALSGVNGTTSWSVAIPCASLSNGSHTISVTANDGTNTSTPVTASFIFDAANPTITITPQGPVTTGTVTVAGTAQDNDQVAAIDIAVNGASRTSVSITPGASIDWSAANVTLTPGTNTITAYATDRAGNEGSAATTIVYNQPTFTLSASTTSAQVNAGTSATFRLTATSVNTFAGTVSLTSAGGPPSNSRSFVPASLTLVAGGTATTDLTVNTNGTDVGGPYTITVTATSGSITRTQTLTMSVDVAADFSVSAAPSSQTVVAGGTAVYTISMAGSATYVMQQGGFTVTAGTGLCSGGPRQGQSCQLAADCTGGSYSCDGVLPAGVTSSWGTLNGDASHSGVASLALSLRTTSTSPVSNAAINVIVDDENGNIHTIQVQLTATPPPDIAVSFNSASAAVTAGPSTDATSTTFFNATVTALNGYSGTVGLAFDTVPADPAITATISPATLTPSSSGSPVTVNIHVDSAVACAPTSGTTCTYVVRLIGTPNIAGVSQKTATADLVVTPDRTRPTITNPTASPDYNTVTITWQTSEPADSQVTIYADAAHTNVVQTAFDATRCTGSCHALALAPLNPVTTYYYSITSVDGAYPTGNSTTIYDDGATLLQFTTTAAPDLTQPVFIFDQPGDGTEVIGTVQVAGHASDNSPLDHLSLTITPSAGGAAVVDQQFPCTDTSCSFTYAWNTMQASPAFPNGNYVLTAWAVSTTGRVTPTVNYAESVHQSRVITVNNDTSAPQVLCLAGQTGTCQPQARNLVCTGGYCTITIVWRTDDLSTSEVEYGLSTNCSEYKVRPDGTSIPCTYTNSQRYDDLDPTNSNPVYRDHSVTLTNLLPDQLYHYRITSCNISNLCTN